jgi:hypothetical protein
MKSQVGIYFTGGDPLDRAFADAVATKVRDFSTPHLIDIDELDRAEERGEELPRGGTGAGIFVVSPSMVAKEHNRRKLARASPKVGLPGHTGFYICRGTTVEWLQETYRDLYELFDKLTVGEEHQLAEMLEELRDYVLHPEARFRPGTLWAVKWLASVLIVMIGIVVSPLAHLALIAPIGMIYLILAGQTVPPWWNNIFVVLALFGFGWWLNCSPALDLWPWLGRRWKFTPGWEPSLSDRLPNPHLSREWRDHGCLSPPQADAPHSQCTAEELGCAEMWWLDTARHARFWSLMRLCTMLVPAAILIRRHNEVLFVTGAAALAIGFAFPIFYYWGSNWMRAIAYWNIGLTTTELERTDKFFDVTKPINLGVAKVTLENADNPRVIAEFRQEAWFYSQTWATSRQRRAWRCPSDKIFISYAWKDAADVVTARRIADNLSLLGKSVFLDKREIPRFAAWRSQVSQGLLECTHLIVVIGPATRYGRICRREIKMSMQRWDTELFPSIICVVEPNTADELLTDEDIPLEMRFLLRWCPRLNYTEASDAKLLDSLIRQRRRQGMLRDWCAILWPNVALSRLRHRLISCVRY